MQGLSSDKTFTQLIYSYGAMGACKNERAQFLVCRATPLGKEGEPSVCENQVNKFLTCYSQVARQANTKCNKEFQTIHDCLKKNEGGSETSTVCSNDLENFAK